MNISSTPFIRNDYWPDYNDIDILNKRIDEAENETSLVNSRLTNDIENVSNNLNSYKDEMADTVITNNIIVNNLNANYAIGKYANFANTNTDNAYVENLTVNKPVFDLTLNTPHVENITSLGGNFYDANMFNVAIDNLLINTQSEPITSSAVLGYDSEGRVIPIHAAFEVGFPENANYLFTDQYGTAFPGIAETEVNASNNLITSNAVYNALANVNNSFNDTNNNFANIDNNFNDVANNFNDVANNFNAVANNFNDVNNTANNLLDNVDYLKTALAPLLNLPVANVSGWINSTTPVNIQGIKSFEVAPFAAPAMLSAADVGGGAKLEVTGTTARLGLPGFQWTMKIMDNTFYGCSSFNQNIAIPNGVTELRSTFIDCYAFNQNIQIPNSVTALNDAFVGCKAFNQNILIPNSVTSVVGGITLDSGTLHEISCPNLNQCILIPNSVTNMLKCFMYCNNLRQPDMYIYSQNVTQMYSAFKGCHINNIHVPTSIPKDTSNFMYNCLVNGDTGITFPAANIFNDLPVDIEQWPPV